MSSASVGVCEVKCMLNLGKCISNNLLLFIHMNNERHHETDSISRIDSDLFPRIDFVN